MLAKVLELLTSAAFYKPCKYESVKNLLEKYFSAELNHRVYQAVHQVVQFMRDNDAQKYQILVLKFQTQLSTEKIADTMDMNERRIHEKLEEVYNLLHKNLIAHGICDNVFEFE